MGLRFGRQYTVVSGIIVFLIVVISGWLLWRHQGSSIVTNSTNTDPALRNEYAALYQAAWRQDDGTQPTLVTATLLVPPAITDIGRDTGRSSTEDQMWSTLKHVTTKQMAVILTLDSVAGTISDQAIQDSLQLSIKDGPAMTLESWTPIIAPSRMVNTKGNTSSQSGIAVFAAPKELNWSELGAIHLNVNKLAGQHDRTFNWAQPKLLLQVQE